MLILRPGNSATDPEEERRKGKLKIPSPPRSPLKLKFCSKIKLEKFSPLGSLLGLGKISSSFPNWASDIYTWNRLSKNSNSDVMYLFLDLDRFWTPLYIYLSWTSEKFQASAWEPWLGLGIISSLKNLPFRATYNNRLTSTLTQELK